MNISKKELKKLEGKFRLMVVFRGRKHYQDSTIVCPLCPFNGDCGTIKSKFVFYWSRNPVLWWKNTGYELFYGTVEESRKSPIFKSLIGTHISCIEWLRYVK